MPSHVIEDHGGQKPRGKHEHKPHCHASLHANHIPPADYACATSKRENTSENVAVVTVLLHATFVEAVIGAREDQLEHSTAA
jgi:hypothetical protein